jgi:hypothetical protein
MIQKSNKINEIIETFPDEQIILMDGFDDAIIGAHVTEAGVSLVYSIGDMVECLVRDGMTEDEAVDYFEYNVSRSVTYVENGPILIYTDFN